MNTGEEKSKPGQNNHLFGIQRSRKCHEGHTRSMLFATVCYLVVDLHERKIAYANAGHPWPLHLRRREGLVETLRNNGSKPGPALGLIGHFEHHTEERSLTEGDALLLFTDGVFEVVGPNDEQFGNTRLLDVIG